MIHLQAMPFNQEPSNNKRHLPPLLATHGTPWHTKNHQSPSDLPELPHDRSELLVDLSRRQPYRASDIWGWLKPPSEKLNIPAAGLPVMGCQQRLLTAARCFGGTVGTAPWSQTHRGRNYLLWGPTLVMAGHLGEVFLPP